MLFVKEIVDSSGSPKDEKKAGEILNENVKTKKKAKKQSKMSAFFGKDSEVIIESDENIMRISGKESNDNTLIKEIPKGTIIVENVIFLLPDKRFNGEGRWVQLETPDFYFINTYVPNSGQNLERLDYRVDEW